MSSSTPGTFLVVGAGPGIGLAAARRFAREGYQVGLIGRTPDRLTELSEALTADGVTTATATADVTDSDALGAAITSIHDRLGPIEVMLFSPRPNTDWIKPVLETTPDDLSAALHLSVVGAAAAVRAVVPAMRANGHGTLLLTTGGAAVEPHPGRAVSGIAYAAETAYVRMLHDTLAEDGVHAAQVTIVGAVAAGGAHEPSAVADELWQRHIARDRPLVVLLPRLDSNQ